MHFVGHLQRYVKNTRFNDQDGILIVRSRKFMFYSSECNFSSLSFILSLMCPFLSPDIDLIG